MVIDVCALCSAVMLLLLWISLGWIKREIFFFFFFFCKVPCSLLLCDLQGGSPKETLLIKAVGFLLALLPPRIAP